MNIEFPYIQLKSIVCFIYVYMTVFGPKLFGFCDLSVVTSIVVLFYFFIKGQIYEYTKTLLVILSFIIIYVLSVAFFSENGLDFIFLLKFVRVFLAVLCISNFVESNVVSANTIRNALVNVLLLHAFFVIVGSAFWPQFQDIIRPLSGFERTPILFRSTGLTNGYDFSGLLCIFGLLLSCLSNPVKLKTLKMVVFVIAALLTSRMNMLLTEMTIFFLIVFYRKGNILRTSILCVFFAVSIIPALGIFLITTQNDSNMIVDMLLKNEFFSGISSELIYHYTVTDISRTASNHFDFSRLTNLQFVMGAMQDAKQDPGYTQYIYEIGVVGVFVTFLFYAKVIVQTFVFRYVNKREALVVILMCLLCLIMSIKNSYLFARHVTETMLIVFSLLCSDYNKIRIISQNEESFL